MDIEVYINNLASENSYLLTSPAGQLLIDPGSDLAYLADLTDLKAVLLTHAHFDHIIGLAAVREKFPQVPIYLHEAEKDWPKDPSLNASTLLSGKAVTTPEATDFYKIGRPYRLGGYTFFVCYTPGHSIGSVSLVFDDFVFTGDTLFHESIGRTDLPTADFDQLIDSAHKELLTLPPDMIIYPGHGEASTIEHEIKNNPFLQG